MSDLDLHWKNFCCDGILREKNSYVCLGVRNYDRFMGQLLSVLLSSSGDKNKCVGEQGEERRGGGERVRDREGRNMEECWN